MEPCLFHSPAAQELGVLFVSRFFFPPRGKQAQPLNFPRLLNGEVSRLTLARQGSTAPVGASLDAWDARRCATMLDCAGAEWF